MAKKDEKTGRSSGQSQGQASERATVIHEGLPTQLPDIDPDETVEWLESLDKMIEERVKTMEETARKRKSVQR